MGKPSLKPVVAEAVIEEAKAKVRLLLFSTHAYAL